MQEERWRGGERKGSAWVSRDNVIAEDEEDEDSEEEDDKSDYSEAAVAERPATTVVDDASPTDRLQVWRCRRQGRLERNFELDNGLPPLPQDPDSGGGGLSFAVPPCLADGQP